MHSPRHQAAPREQAFLRGVGNLFVGLVASVLMGVLLAGLLAPAVGAGVLAKRPVDAYLALETELELPALAQRTRILAADGSTLAWLYNQNRVRVPLTRVPRSARDALLAVEDAGFYEHSGVDLRGLVRAAARNARAGDVEQGGSTLTQQYVKNALIASATTAEERRAASEVSLSRKAQEARYALALERRLSKDQILERYLNIAYYGNGVYGIGTAAGYYFGKPVEELTVAEGALLAGLVQSPSRYEPVRHPEAALARRDVVLDRMVAAGSLSELHRAAAVAEPLRLKVSPVGSGCEAPGVEAPFFCDYVRRALEDGPLGAALGTTRDERQQRLLSGGLTITTTLDRDLQRRAQRQVALRILSDDPSGVAATFTAVEPGTGEVTALVVNRRFGADGTPGHTKLNLALGGSSGMQAGSLFKPFVAAAALRQGLPLETTFDAPAEYTSEVFKDCGRSGCDEPYTVRNAGDSSSGRHDLVSATQQSVNTYYLQLLERTGVEAPARLAEQLGLRQFAGGAPTAPLHRGGSFVLGVNEVSPLDLTAAYAAFAARGTYCPPRPVTEIRDAAGKALTLPDLPCRRVLQPALADTLTSVLRGTVDGASPGRTARRAHIGRPVAGKTGSTNGSTAAWFAGYTPGLAAAVWVGKPVPEPLRDITIGEEHYRQVYGGTLPAPLWAEIVRQALEGTPVAPLPPIAVSRPVREREDVQLG